LDAEHKTQSKTVLRMKFLTCAAISGNIPTVTESNCLLLLEQAQRFAYFDLPYSGVIGDATTVLAAATYTALMTATDGKKMSLPRPKLYSPELGGTERVNVGSNDNATPQGGSILRGSTIPMFNGRYTGLTPEQYSDFENIYARGNKAADYATLGIIAFLGDDQVLMKKNFKPLEIKVPFIGDPSGMQLHDLTQFAINFELKKGWFRDAAVFQLNFNHETL
jgi:hypothetical protein